jgi:hypothetical protein
MRNISFNKPTPTPHNDLKKKSTPFPSPPLPLQQIKRKRTLTPPPPLSFLNPFNNEKKVLRTKTNPPPFPLPQVK